jgi:acetyl-CoA C-acetyltransferase
MSKRATIVGWAHTPFGKLDDVDIESLITRVSSAALDHAQVAPGDVDMISVGVYNNGTRPAFYPSGSR